MVYSRSLGVRAVLSMSRDSSVVAGAIRLWTRRKITHLCLVLSHELCITLHLFHFCPQSSLRI